MDTKKQKLKQLRQDFRESVFKRDKNKCVFCPITTDLDAHHITDRHEMPNDGYSIWNGISLCAKHHLMAEEYHISKGERSIEGFHPNDLYQKIGSSYEKAVEESRKLIREEKVKNPKK